MEGEWGCGWGREQADDVPDGRGAETGGFGVGGEPCSPWAQAPLGGSPCGPAPLQPSWQGEEESSRTAPTPAQSKHCQFLSVSTQGSRWEANGQLLLGPHFHGSPLPHVLCMSQSRFFITLATSGHTGASMGSSGPGLGHSGGSWVRPGPPRGLRRVCNLVGKPQCLVFPAFVPRAAGVPASPACPSWVMSSLERRPFGAGHLKGHRLSS